MPVELFIFTGRTTTAAPCPRSCRALPKRNANFLRRYPSQSCPLISTILSVKPVCPNAVKGFGISQEADAQIGLALAEDTLLWKETLLNILIHKHAYTFQTQTALNKADHSIHIR